MYGTPCRAILSASCSFRVNTQTRREGNSPFEIQRSGLFNEIRQLQVDLSYVNCDLSQKSKEDQPDDSTRVISEVETIKGTPINCEKEANSAISAENEPDSSEFKNVSTRKRKHAQSDNVTPVQKNKSIYSAIEVEEQLKESLKSLLNSVNHIYTLRSSSPQSKKAELTEQLVSLYNLFILNLL